MSHELTSTDRLLLHKDRAWHGLGNVVDEALGPVAGLKYLGLTHGIEQLPLFARKPDGTEIEVPTHLLNIRDDNDAQMGLVGSNYMPIQPIDLARFCEALVDDGKVLCETIGTIRGGKKIWFLLKGEPFDIANGDTQFPYLLISDGYDGWTTFRGTPTIIRAVCKNTLTAIIPDMDTGKLNDSAFVIRHTKNVMARVGEAKEAIAKFNRGVESTVEVAKGLAAKDVTSDDVKKFFLECYTADFGEVPTNPKTKVEENRRNRAMSAFGSFSRRFDDEKAIAGTSYWNAFNAYSGLIQHDRKAVGKDDDDRVIKRIDSNLFGLSHERTQAAFGLAYAHAV